MHIRNSMFVRTAGPRTLVVDSPAARKRVATSFGRYLEGPACFCHAVAKIWGWSFNIRAGFTFCLFPAHAAHQHSGMWNIRALRICLMSHLDSYVGQRGTESRQNAQNHWGYYRELRKLLRVYSTDLAVIFCYFVDHCHFSGSDNHAFASDIDTIAQLIYDTLFNSCGTDQTARSTCAMAKVTADAWPAMSSQTDTFNKVLASTSNYNNVHPVDKQENQVPRF